MSDRILVIGNTCIIVNGLISYNDTLNFVPTIEVSGNEKANNVKYLPYCIHDRSDSTHWNSITFVWLSIKPNVAQTSYKRGTDVTWRWRFLLRTAEDVTKTRGFAKSVTYVLKTSLCGFPNVLWTAITPKLNNTYQRPVMDTFSRRF